jgi:hypothetical protein
MNLEKNISAKVDRLQFELGKMPQADMPLRHWFTPGLYVREISMPKGAIVISRVHRTEHPFVISKGSVSVLDEHGQVTHYNAPHTGVTKPGARRVLYIHEDCIWTTFHPGAWPAGTDPDVIVAELTDTPDVSYIGQLTLEQLRELTGEAH